MNDFQKSQSQKILASYGIDLEKGRKSFPIGSLDKSKRNIKTADGWKPVKLHSHLIKEENKKHNAHLIEVLPNKYVYHTSNPFFRDKILKEGLITKGKSETWLSDTNIEGDVIFVVNSDDKEDLWESGYDDDIYIINTYNLKHKWYNDPNFDLNHKRIITFENIPSNSIKLIYKGTGNSID